MPQTPDRTPTESSSPRPTTLALLGLVLVLSGVVGYFLIVLRLGGWFPSVRNNPIPNWILVAAGVALSLLATGRASAGRRLVPGILLGVNLLLTGTFAAFLYVMLVVPEARGPVLGTTAPDFALADQSGQTRRLADFRGNPLLLVFYRGHW